VRYGSGVIQPWCCGLLAGVQRPRTTWRASSIWGSMAPGLRVRTFPALQRCIQSDPMGVSRLATVVYPDWPRWCVQIGYGVYPDWTTIYISKKV
jgi:hypothetical protein